MSPASPEANSTDELDVEMSLLSQDAEEMTQVPGGDETYDEPMDDEPVDEASPPAPEPDSLLPLPSGDENAIAPQGQMGVSTSEVRTSVPEVDGLPQNSDTDEGRAETMDSIHDAEEEPMHEASPASDTVPQYPEGQPREESVGSSTLQGADAQPEQPATGANSASPELEIVQDHHEVDPLTDATDGTHTVEDAGENTEVDQEEADREDEEDAIDEDGLPMVKEPCANIRDELEELFGGDLAFQGSFAFAQTYHAPLPALSLEGLGTVGLPLSDRDAAAIKSRCVQAPFGKGARTVIDREVRDTWEMDAPLVAFRNPEWAPWLNGVVGEVCATLGVNVAASRPKAELYKLLLYETGSHFLPHVDTEKADGMFATIVVVLPSEFTGGDAHLSHGGQSNVFNSSTSSLTKTTVLAWYTDVMHEIKPITSGYRLALAFNLIHTTNTLRPALTEVTATVTALRHVLLSWKQYPDGAPDKIIYMLEHKYSQANLSASALKSRDAHLLAILDGLAKELGFCLGLANIEHSQRGCADDEYGSRRGWDRYGDDSDEDDDEDDVGMAEVDEEDTSVKNLVNIEGKPIKKEVDFDDEVETIPRFSGYFEGEDYDHQDYEGYQGNGAGSLERFYRRTALVIWPKWGSIGGAGGGDRRAAYALEVLQAAKGIEPVGEEQALYDYLLTSARYLARATVLKTMSKITRQWGNLNGWIANARACAGEMSGSLLPIEEIAAASQMFGFPALTDAIKHVLLHDPTNASRYAYLQKLAAWADIPENEHLRQPVNEFVTTMRRTMLESIKQPTATEAPLLINEAGTVSAIHTIVLPQLRKLCGVDVLDIFAAYLHEQTSRIAPSPEDRALVQTILGELLAGQVDKVDFFKGVVAKQPIPPGYYGAKPSTGSPDIALAFIKKCVAYGNPAIAAAALGHMLDRTALPADVCHLRTEQVLLPLVPLLCNDPSVRAAIPDELMSKLGQIVVQQMISVIQTKSGQISRKNLGLMLDTATQTGNAELITESIVPKLKALPWNENGWAEIIREMHHRQNSTQISVGASDAFRTAVAEMIKTYALKVALPQQNRATLLDFCLQAGGHASLSVVLQRFLKTYLSPASSITAHLVPLFSDIIGLTRSKHMSPASEPLASTIKEILTAWTTHVLGPRPSNSAVVDLNSNLARFQCSCPHCTEVRTFLRSGERSINLNLIYATKAKHVQKELSISMRGLVNSSIIPTTPQGLRVEKSAALYASTAWTATQARGRELLQSIGSENLQRQVLGDSYQAIANAVGSGNQSTSSSVPRPAAAVSTSRPAGGSSLMAAARAAQSQKAAARTSVAAVATAAAARPAPTIAARPPTAATTLKTAPSIQANDTSRLGGVSMTTAAALALATAQLAGYNAARAPIAASAPASAPAPAPPPPARVQPPTAPSRTLAQPTPTRPAARAFATTPLAPSKRKTDDLIDLTTPSPEPKRTR